MVSRDRVKCYLDCFISVEGEFSHQVIKSPSVEDSFDFAEDCLDWIELWAITHVPYGHYVERGEVRLSVLSLVNLQLVHKERERTLSMLFPQLFQELNEFGSFKSFWIDRVRTYALFFGHGGYDCLVSCVNPYLIDSKVGVGS